jgi:hypothetical protein
VRRRRRPPWRTHHPGTVLLLVAAISHGQPGFAGGHSDRPWNNRAAPNSQVAMARWLLESWWSRTRPSTTCRNSRLMRSHAPMASFRILCQRSTETSMVTFGIGFGEAHTGFFTRSSERRGATGDSKPCSKQHPAGSSNRDSCSRADETEDEAGHLHSRLCPTRLVRFFFGQGNHERVRAWIENFRPLARPLHFITTLIYD